MKKIFTLCTCLMLAICLTGCNMKKSVKFKIKFYGESDFSAFYYTNDNYERSIPSPTIIRIIRSLDELITMCEEYNCPAFNEKSDKYSYELNELIRSFTQEYFDSKSLVIYFGLNSGSEKILRNKIKFIVIEDDTLMIKFKEKDKNAQSLQMMIPWTLIVEVNKGAILNVDKVEVI